jgi:aminopeptidase N
MNPQYSWRIVVVFLTLWLAACTEDAGQEPPPVESQATRIIADALDLETAQQRASRITNVRYDVFIDVVSRTDEFAGEVRIAFDLTDASSDLTVDFSGGSIASILVNGDPVDVNYSGYFITISADNLIVGENSIEISYAHPFVEDGTGLHRFVDPEDGLTYLYTYLWPYYANRLLPSFDQPNLKAEFALRVLAPQDWVVVSAAPGSHEPPSDGKSLWNFATTPKISTYAFSLHAGPYAVWEDNDGDVPLRLMARQSLAEYVAVDEWLEITRRGIEFFNEYFDIPYPYAKYDQLIVPEFNIGGMENVAAVTYGELYVQRQQSDRAQRESRAGVVLHELAHMWFGDLVTHDWWNGMWLNESFATQMAALAKAEVTEFDDTWHGFFTNRKSVAYYVDSRVTTHPIEQSIDTTAEFFKLFDAITYRKGASVLKQLQHLVGADNYRRGVSTYLKENAWGTTTLTDFIGHQEKAAQVDLGPWFENWLLRSGFNSLGVETACENGELQSLVVNQAAPDDHPYLRTHKIDIAMYGESRDGQLQVDQVIPVQVDGATTEVAIPEGVPCPVIINPNHNDWAYARIRLSESDEAVLSERLGDITDPLGRSIFLAALRGKATAGEMPIADFVRQALTLAEGEKNVRVLEQITRSIVDAVNLLQRLRPESNEVLDRLVPGIEKLSLREAEYATARDVKYLWLETFLGVVSTEAGLGTARALLDGRATINGIEISPELRWRLLIILSRNGVPIVPELLQTEAERDPSDLGQRNALAARAAMPVEEVKVRWLEELRNPQAVTSLARQRAVMSELFPASQTDLQLKLLGRTLEAIPELSRKGDIYFLSSYASSLLTPMCREESTAMLQETLDTQGATLDPTTLRFLREAHQADAECAALRSVQ